MQAIALVTNDKFLLNYNITIDTNDVIDYIQKLNRTFYNFSEGYNPVLLFLEQFAINFTNVISHHGVCFDFNIVNASQLFHLDKFVNL